MLIKEDGTVKIKPVTAGVGLGGSMSALLVAGNLGGGTALVGYMNGDTGVFSPFKDSTGLVNLELVSGRQYQIAHGMGIDVYVQLTGSTSPILSVLLAPLV